MSAERELSFGERLALARKEQMALVKASRPANRSKESAEARAAKAEAKRLNNNELQQQRRAKRIAEKEGYQATLKADAERRRNERTNTVIKAKEDSEARRKAKQQQQAKKQPALLLQNDMSKGHATESSYKRRVKIRTGGPNIAGKVLTQIDDKTWVYLEPGADLAEVKYKLDHRHDHLNKKQAHNNSKSDLNY
jgi:hypothetical protein